VYLDQAAGKHKHIRGQLGIWRDWSAAYCQEGNELQQKPLRHSASLVRKLSSKHAKVTLLVLV